MKNKRLDAIRSLLTDNTVQSQEELQSMLKDKGFIVTQATLSRDLRELHVVKVHDSRRGYKYELPSEAAPAAPLRPVTFTPECIKTVEFSGSRAVIKTFPGFADAVASVIDENIRSGIMGTIAGDDTVLIILREPVRIHDVLATMAFYLPGIENKLISQ